MDIQDGIQMLKGGFGILNTVFPVQPEFIFDLTKVCGEVVSDRVKVVERPGKPKIITMTLVNRQKDHLYVIEMVFETEFKDNQSIDTVSAEVFQNPDESTFSPDILPPISHTVF